MIRNLSWLKWKNKEQNSILRSISPKRSVNKNLKNKFQILEKNIRKTYLKKYNDIICQTANSVPELIIIFQHVAC